MCEPELFQMLKQNLTVTQYVGRTWAVELGIQRASQQHKYVAQVFARVILLSGIAVMSVTWIFVSSHSIKSLLSVSGIKSRPYSFLCLFTSSKATALQYNGASESLSLVTVASLDFLILYSHSFQSHSSISMPQLSEQTAANQPGVSIDLQCTLRLYLRRWRRLSISHKVGGLIPCFFCLDGEASLNTTLTPKLLSVARRAAVSFSYRCVSVWLSVCVCVKERLIEKCCYKLKTD